MISRHIANSSSTAFHHPGARSYKARVASKTAGFHGHTSTHKSNVSPVCFAQGKRIEPPSSPELYLDQLKVIGEIPKGLVGTYLRNGPNVTPGSLDQYFFGQGMIHAVSLCKNGNATYRSQSCDVPKSWPYSDLPNVSVLQVEDAVLACGDIGLPRELSVDTLKTIRPIDFGGMLKGNFSGHARVTNDNQVEFLSCQYHDKPYLRFIKTSLNGEGFKAIDVDLEKPTMIHDFSSVDDFFVFVDHAVKFNLYQAAANFMLGVVLNQGNSLAFRWDAKHETAIRLVSKHSEDLNINIPTENFACFHHANSYVLNNKIVLDLVKYSKLFEEGPYDYARLGTITRFEIDKEQQTYSEIFQLDDPVEMPIINPAYAGREYGVCYALSTSGVAENQELLSGFGNGLLKYQFTSGQPPEREFYDALEDGYGLGEFIFVENPHTVSHREDDGFLIGYAFHLNSRSSELWIKDAQNINSEPVARIEIGHHVPHGFHGAWVSDNNGTTKEKKVERV